MVNDPVKVCSGAAGSADMFQSPLSGVPRNESL